MFEVRLQYVIAILVREYLKNINNPIIQFDDASITKKGICI